MSKRILMASILSLAALFFISCRDSGSSTRVPAAAESGKESEALPAKQEIAKESEALPAKQESASGEAVADNAAETGIISIDFKPGFHLSEDSYTALEFSAKAPEYTLKDDLSNIENIGQFANLTQKQRDMIAQNGFVVIPTDSEQLFYIYEDNAYKKVPSFVTADSVLQLYHIFYNYSLRSLETDFFYQDLIQLNENMIRQLMLEYGQAKNEEIKENILRMIGYFGVADLAMGRTLPSDFPAKLTDPVNREWALISKAEEKEKSPLFGFYIDYSLFQVRGHYTRSEELGRYFKAMNWYGAVPIPFYNQDGERDEQSAMRAIVTTIALCRLPQEEGTKLWENIYSTTSFYVGESDDISPYEVAEAIYKVYSDAPDINEIPDKMDGFYQEVEQMRKPDIVLKTEASSAKPQMRFMGQRYIPDSEILQKLSEPFQRPFPSGLDVFAVFGSKRAEELLDEVYKPNLQWSGYQENFDLLKQKFQSQTIPEQTSNLYNGWLYSLKGLTVKAGKGYPFFMRNKAWEDKSLSTALGSWSEIRHDTILYGKQSAAECGGGTEPPELVGYVEPNPEFFSRLLWLTTATRENLNKRKLLNENMQYKLEQFEEMLRFLKTCAEKELSGEDLSVEEQYTLLTYGGTLEYLSSSIAESNDWYLIESDTDKNMAVIADIHSSDASCLEVGVGTACEMYVAIPQNGKIYLTRGAVFDFYEFISEERLTDEAWQKKIAQDPPKRPSFTKSYLDEKSGKEVPVPDEPYSAGC